jgi:membrane-bound serine protease (ClpP class)
MNLAFFRNRRKMDTVLLNPNIAYLFLAGGVLLTFFALVTPGTGFLEVGAFFLMALAGYSIYSLPIHIWALILLIASLFPFGIAIRKAAQRGIYLGTSIFGVIVGSAYLFRGEGLAPAVNIWLVIIVSALMGGFLWLIITKTLEALEVTPAHNINGLIGRIGEAKSPIHDEGSAQIAGELWSARSQHPIKEGTHVRVLNRDGFILDVEAIEE